MQKGLNCTWSQLESGTTLLWTQLFLALSSSCTWLPHSSFTRIVPLTTWGPPSLTPAWESVPRPHTGRRVQLWVVSPALFDPDEKTSHGIMKGFSGASSYQVQGGKLCSWLSLGPFLPASLMLTTAARFKNGHHLYIQGEKILFWNLGWSGTPASEDLPCAVRWSKQASSQLNSE